ncbi:hypothetical protein ABTX77_38185 [Streptomyces sp. NPDC097704]|uniref:hypothetical protein n=1 Tax=Streptomyces sp. NPDC097704 TaxID=3157101 RepID=UPI00332917DD
MAEIRIDSSGLTFTKFSVSGHSPDLVDGAGAPVVSLAPGVYGIEQIPGRPASFEFQVTQGGLVEYAPANDAFLGGRGTSTLILRGFPVTLDGRALSHDLEVFLKGSTARFARSAVHELTLLPAEGYGFVPGPRVVVPLFDLNPDGTVHLTESVAQCGSVGVSADGTPLVTIRGFTVTIDGRALSHDLRLFLDGNDAVLSRATTHELVLIPAAGYGFVLARGFADFRFTLTPEGQVSLHADHVGFAEASGPTLTIRGYKVTVDARALSHDLTPELLGWTGSLSRATTHELTLIPSQQYMFFLARGLADFHYALTADGQITIPPDFNPFAEATGRTLTIRGYKITLDARALSHDLTPELLGWTGSLSRATTHELTLIPSQQYMFFLARGLADFHFALTVDGQIALESWYAGFAEATGRTLTIRGYKITLDARALSHDLTPELLGWTGSLSRATTHELTLIPSQQYMFFLARGLADFHYALTADGQITIPPDFNPFAEATGRTLTIRGYKITLDARALSHDLTPELLGWTGSLSRATTHELTLIPSQQYMFFLARGLADFHYALTADGQITIPPDCSAFAEATGRTLAIRGYKITLDARVLSHDLTPELLGWTGVLSRATTHELTLIPSQQYMFFLARGLADFHYALTADGQITIPPDCSAFAEATGRTLTIRGYKITLDARALSHDLTPELLGWTGALPRATTHELTLIPSQQYMFFLARGLADFEYALTRDGSLSVPPRYAAFAKATGRTLTIRGFTVTLNGRALSHDLTPELLGWTGVLSRATTHELTLIPSQQYMFFLARGLADFHFALTVDGQISLEPRYAGFASVSWRTLTIHGYQVTVDGRALSHDLLPELLGWTAGALSRAEAHELTLIPSAQYVMTGVGVPGVQVVFSVGVDGTVVIATGPEGLLIFLSGSAVPRADPFALRRALDEARLQHDAQQADVDARTVTLGRVQVWFDGSPEVGPDDYRPLPVLRAAERVQGRGLEELAQMRAKFDDAGQRLKASLDAEAPLFGADNIAPIALLPVRIETKWTADGRGLKVRVYPDDIHIDAFDPALTRAELDAAHAYWDDPGDHAWHELLRKVSAPRAAWATRAARPGAPAPQLRDPGRRRAPRVTTLPARWRFLGLVDGRVAVDKTGVDIPALLPLGLLAADESAQDHEHAEWAIDFEAAVAAGMGTVLTLPAEFDHLDELFVLGVSDLSPQDAAKELRRCLHGHAFGDGLGFLAPGTPTNNTPETTSAWSSRPSPMPPGPPPVLADHTDASRLAKALGLSDAGFLAECTGAAYDGDGPVAALSLLSWWSLAYGFQSEAVANDTGVPQSDAERRAAHERWVKVRNHLVDHVRSRGPLPTVRVGRQPYGVLPVTALDEWVPDREDGADALLLPWLQRLRHHWRAALTPGWIPRVTDGTPADWMAADILTRLPVSNDLVIRREFTSRGGREKIDGISKRAPGPALALCGIRSGLRWTIPSEEISNLAWTSNTTEPDYSHVPERLAPNADKYAALFDDSRRRLTDAVAFLRDELTQAQYLARWPLTAAGAASPDRPPTIFGHFRFGTADKATDLVPLMVNGDGRDVFFTHTDGFIGDGFDIAFDIPNAVDTAIRKRLEEGAGSTAAASLLEQARQGLASAGALTTGLRALAGVPADKYLPLAFELFDVYSHRWDAWAASLAAKRLSESRAAGTMGIRLGGYGWVENLYPGSVRPSDGFIHAPSLHHAATAAVLRSGFLAHRDAQSPAAADATSPLAVDLTSRRARVARWLLGGVRRGQSLGALLGYRFERALHDAGLDPQKDPFRRAFPAPVAHEPTEGEPEPGLWERSTEAIAARNVVDGIALARAHSAGTVDAVLAGHALPPADLRVVPALDDLVDALDAVSDLLLAESVHQLVGGNPLRAGLAADSLGAGQHVPDRLDVLRTPHRGRAVTHRIAAVLPPASSRPAGWGTDPFSALEPRVDAWVAHLLGPADTWRLAGTTKVDAAPARPFAFTLEQIGFSPLGVVLDVAGSVHRRLHRRVGELAQAPGAEVDIREGWDELRAVTGRIQALLVGAAPLLPAHLLGDEDALPAPDLENVRVRVAGFVAKVGDPQQRRALGVDGDPARLAELAGDATGPGWLAEVTRVLAEFLGSGLPLAPPLPDVSLPPSAADATGAAVADWVRRFGSVRPAVRTWHETLLLAGARTGRPSRLSASQTPAGGSWIGGSFEPRERPPAQRHLVCHIPVPPSGAQQLAGIVCDEWVEVLPGADALAANRTSNADVPAESELTGVSFHFDRPDAKAPHAVLVAVPPHPVRGWTADGLALVLRDTLELAKMRAVDLADLPLLSDILPGLRVGEAGTTALASMIEDFWIDLAEE